ncbi:MAG: Asp-tRNA(Asn)/Glu-tRNA(Gln) amidotransferase subunit GatB [Planctomycetota bacterium]
MSAREQQAGDDELPYQLIIGLEVHVQLATESKLFCRCSTKFGAPPNTQTCPVCIGLPGALPVMNRRAYELSLRTALALNCQIPTYTKWDRKNYYYPDLPKGYQISQYDLPMSSDGWLEIQDPKEEFPAKRVGIIRAHLEEDAGKSMHDEAAGKADSRIDLNRCGTPLLEIVSRPDMHSPREARAYLTELKLLLTYLGVSDCNMQAGNLRVDANVNLHIETPEGLVATPIVEVKNMNSFRAVERALAYEAQRQQEAWHETGRRKGDVPKQTRGWDDQRLITFGQREKEESSDYRYFPDPDLAPVVVTVAEVEAAREALGELPAQLRERLQHEYKLTHYDADVIVNQGRTLVDYYLQVAQGCGDGKQACNWVTQEVLRLLNERETTIETFAVSSVELAKLLSEIQRGTVPGPRAKEVFAEMESSGSDVATALAKLGIAAVDTGELEALCTQLLADNPRVVADVKAGKAQAVASLIGQAKKRNANVNPNDVRATCLKIIESM